MCDRRPSVGYVMRERIKGLERVCKRLLDSKAKPSPPKPSVKFKSQIWLKITKEFVKKCLAGD